MQTQAEHSYTEERLAQKVHQLLKSDSTRDKIDCVVVRELKGTHSILCGIIVYYEDSINVITVDDLFRMRECQHAMPTQVKVYKNEDWDISPKMAQDLALVARFTDPAVEEQQQQQQVSMAQPIIQQQARPTPDKPVRTSRRKKENVEPKEEGEDVPKKKRGGGRKKKVPAEQSPAQAEEENVKKPGQVPEYTTTAPVMSSSMGIFPQQLQQQQVVLQQQQMVDDITIPPNYDPTLFLTH